jgi:hypothetical protein
MEGRPQRFEGNVEMESPVGADFRNLNSLSIGTAFTLGTRFSLRVNSRIEIRVIRRHWKIERHCVTSVTNLGSCVHSRHVPTDQPGKQARASGPSLSLKSIMPVPLDLRDLHFSHLKLEKQCSPVTVRLQCNSLSRMQIDLH